MVAERRGDGGWKGLQNRGIHACCVYVRKPPVRSGRPRSRPGRPAGGWVIEMPRIPCGYVKEWSQRRRSRRRRRPARKRKRSRRPPAPTAADPACMASTPDGLVYKGFEGVVVEANGFRFSAGVTISSANAEASGGGWAETMSLVGRAGDEMVVPSLGAPRGSAVGFKSTTLPSAAAAELGWKAPNTRMLIAVSSASAGSTFTVASMGEGGWVWGYGWKRWLWRDCGCRTLTCGADLCRLFRVLHGSS